MPENTRETFASRLGFIFLSAGCAIGLGNVWRFPFITGKYGGAAFVLLYIIFLLFFALPIMVMEFSVGRASKQSPARSFAVLRPDHKVWSLWGYVAWAGNYLLMMFYTTVTGWMIAYTYHSAAGNLSVLKSEEIGKFFGGLLADPNAMVFWMAISVIIGATVCFLGLRKGVERITKLMMCGLLVIMIALAVRSVTLEGADKGLEFYLKPDFSKLTSEGLGTTLYAALGQAFFTLSLGIGSMAIFGSYIEKDRSLFGESLIVTGLDTFVALTAGLIIFPACFAYGINPDAGPGLIFVTLPNMFNQMPNGKIWGTLFFLFMSFAALSTVIAVFETIVACFMDRLGWSRRFSVIFMAVTIFVLSIPCALGFNEWSFIQPLGEGTGVLDLEDFIVSNNLLPIGSIVYLLFCVTRYGWGWDNFVKEADEGTGLKFPKALRFYFTFVVPVIMCVVLGVGYYQTFAK
ncbi:MAG: sodium-dependent transporter [Synergistaceae bacterium]|nr:sodium-dependent transporter [Synergistaceae bacterium]MBR0315574.1 sodium-dependent transporter [Synergistaceae bacterium]